MFNHVICWILCAYVGSNLGEARARNLNVNNESVKNIQLAEQCNINMQIIPFIAGAITARVGASFQLICIKSLQVTPHSYSALKISLNARHFLFTVPIVWSKYEHAARDRYAT